MQPTTTTSFNHHHLRRLLQTPPQPPPSWASSSIPPVPLTGTPSSIPFPDIPTRLTSTTPVIILPRIPATGNSCFDAVTITVAIGLITFSIISILLVLHLRVKSRSSRRLHRFTFHSSARILFSALVSLWAINELLRLPISRIQTLIPSFPALTLTQQANLCKFQSVLSLGVFEPGFLVGLLFLVNIPIVDTRQRWIFNSSRRSIWSMVGCILMVCVPLSTTLYIILDQLPDQLPIPKAFMRTAVMLASADQGGKGRGGGGGGGSREVVMCAVPFIGEAMFGVFVILYSVVLLLSCWKVISLAINKRLRGRINILAVTLLVCLTIQVVLSSVEAFWDPEDVMDYMLVFVVFVSVCVCAAVGEGILVIIPVGDALSVGVGPPLGVVEEEAADDALLRGIV